MEMVYTGDLKSPDLRSCGFKSRTPYQNIMLRSYNNMTMSRFWNTSFYSQKLKKFFKPEDYEEASHDLLARMFDLGSDDELTDLVETNYWVVTKNGLDHWVCENDQDARLLSSLLERENPDHRWGVREKQSLIARGDGIIDDVSELVVELYPDDSDDSVAVGS